MRVIALKDVRSLEAEKLDAGVVRDADRLVRLHGGRARDAASLYAWREDSGLLYTPKPGHWHRVKLELAARDDQSAVPAADSPARIQRLHLM